MFLNMTMQRNPALIRVARQLHNAGVIEPDTYVIDLDTVVENAQHIAQTAADYGITPWFVEKQYGRNPLVSKAISTQIPKAAAIDVREALGFIRNGIALGNVGHLVQIPKRFLPRILAARPDFVTVYDQPNLIAVAEAAAQLGIVQKLLLRIAGDPAVTYPGQTGGFEPTAIPAVLKSATAYPNIKISGVTGFPCFIYDKAQGRPIPTATAYRVCQAADSLRSHGIEPTISLPSHSSCSTIPLVAQLGGTHVEPGHALTGSTPEHAIRADLLERPAMVYVSEVLQQQPVPQIAGGGFYARGHADAALLGSDERTSRLVSVVSDPAENIDYYRRLVPASDISEPLLGETAILAFRTQVFVTRSQVAVVGGIVKGSPDLLGIFTAQGDALTDIGSNANVFSAEVVAGGGSG